MLGPDAVSQPWLMDLVSDQLAGGGRVRVLHVADDCSGECVLQAVDLSISGSHAVT